MPNDTVWTPPSAKRKSKELNCPKCGGLATLVPIGKCEGSTVWAPFCQHCEKPWTAEQKRTIQKCINNRRTISQEKFERSKKNPGKGEFSMPESDPSSQAFIKQYLARKHTVIFENKTEDKHDDHGDTKPAVPDQGGSAQRTGKTKARRVPAKAR